jgi:hypothetical protein
MSLKKFVDAMLGPNSFMKSLLSKMSTSCNAWTIEK